jgi:hypothetical protein
MESIVMARFAVIVLLLLPFPILAQLQIEVRTDQDQYLAGEPVFVVEEVKNVGAAAISYSECDGRVSLTVPNGAAKTHPHFTGCGGEGGSKGSGCGGGITSPLLKPGESKTFRYLLRDYRLAPGEYDLRVVGKTIDRTLHLVILYSNENSLRSAYARFFAVVDGRESANETAREAIAEMAPPFLEKTIASFVGDYNSMLSSLAIEALGEINTEESRQDLRRFYTDRANPQLRFMIVHALAGTGARDNMSFLAGVLSDSAMGVNENIRTDAAFGIAFIHGDEAVDALRNAPRSENEQVRLAIIRALGTTESRMAIPALIELSQSDAERGTACWALVELTHHNWCGVDGDASEIREVWQQWWKANAEKATIYGAKQCPGRPDRLPPLR